MKRQQRKPSWRKVRLPTAPPEKTHRDLSKYHRVQQPSVDEVMEEYVDEEEPYFVRKYIIYMLTRTPFVSLGFATGAFVVFPVLKYIFDDIKVYEIWQLSWNLQTLVCYILVLIFWPGIDWFCNLLTSVIPAACSDLWSLQTRWIIVVSFVIMAGSACLLSAYWFSHPQESGQYLGKPTRGELVEVIRDAGFEVVEMGKNGVLLFQSGRWTAGLLSDNDRIMLVAGFKNIRMTPVEMNAWNRDYAFTKVFLGESGNPVLISNIYLGGDGVSRGALVENCQLYGMTLDAFSNEYRKYSSDDPDNSFMTKKDGPEGPGVKI